MNIAVCFARLARSSGLLAFMGELKNVMLREVELCRFTPTSLSPNFLTISSCSLEISFHDANFPQAGSSNNDSNNARGREGWRADEGMSILFNQLLHYQSVGLPCNNASH